MCSEAKVSCWSFVSAVSPVHELIDRKKKLASFLSQYCSFKARKYYSSQDHFPWLQKDLYGWRIKNKQKVLMQTHNFNLEKIEVYREVIWVKLIFFFEFQICVCCFEKDLQNFTLKLQKWLWWQSSDALKSTRINNIENKMT